MSDILTRAQIEKLFEVLKFRFESHMHRHPDMEWHKIQSKLSANPSKLWSLHMMEETGGEPDVVVFESQIDNYLFFDCSPESPDGRRSLCYDSKALVSRKENKPKHSALGLAAEMGIELLTEIQFRELQKSGSYDTKTSSWLLTPDDIRAKGGALFGDYRYGKVFVYHNGAESYYASRGFRGCLMV